MRIERYFRPGGRVVKHFPRGECKNLASPKRDFARRWLGEKSKLAAKFFLSGLGRIANLVNRGRKGVTLSTAPKPREARHFPCVAGVASCQEWKNLSDELALEERLAEKYPTIFIANIQTV
ncbi:MAG: hypothetical protein WBS19_19100 [Candidatus Korobacteraceae bacterium]